MPSADAPDPHRGQPVLTLRNAHERVHRAWPGRDASAAQVIAYHQQAAGLYDLAATTDPQHRHEAQFWVQQERAAAETARREAEPEVSSCRTA